MHNGSFALGGAQANSSSVEGSLLWAKAAPEPNTYRPNLGCRGPYERSPTVLTLRARVSLRQLLGILAERTGLIAKKSPPQRSSTAI